MFVDKHEVETRRSKMNKTIMKRNVITILGCVHIWRDLKRSFAKRIGFLTGSILLAVVLWLHLMSSSDKASNRLTNNWRLHHGSGDPSWLVRNLLTSGRGLSDATILFDLNQKMAFENWTCLNTSTTPSTPVCVYDPLDDNFVSVQLLSDGVWEPRMTKLFLSALSKYPNALVVDLGANVGYYTLIAAKLGHKVIAVEPMMDSVLRLQKAAQLAGTTRLVSMVPKAISDVHELVTFRYKAGNKGGTSVRPVAVSEVSEILKKDKNAIVNTVTMDDLMTIACNSCALTVILKMDIEGYECKAMASSRQFFVKHFVAYVFMEWETMFRNRHRYGSPCQSSHLQITADYLTAWGYKPFATQNGRPLDIKQSSTNWRLGDVLWVHKNAPRLPVGR